MTQETSPLLMAPSPLMLTFMTTFTADVEINDAATIAQIKGIDTPSQITPLASLMT